MSRFNKYLAFARIAARQQLAARGELYGRVLFFAVILGVFSSLWKAAGEAVLPFGADADSLVWYLAATEWILLSAPQLHLDIAEDVRRGDIAAQLPRPVSYVGAVLAQGVGALAIRAPVLAATAVAAAYSFTGILPERNALLLVLPLGLLASALLMACWVLLGLLSFWFTDITPLHWIWQKLLFLCGGLMLPLSFYPAWFQAFAQCTPFPSLLSFPAGSLLGFSPVTLAELLLRFSCWTLITLAACFLLFRRAAQRLQVTGG